MSQRNAVGRSLVSKMTEVPLVERFEISGIPFESHYCRVWIARPSQGGLLQLYMLNKDIMLRHYDAAGRKISQIRQKVEEDPPLVECYIRYLSLLRQQADL